MLARPRKRSRLKVWATVLLAIIVAGLGFVAFRVGPPPRVEVAAKLPGLGPSTPIRVVVQEPRRGVGSVVVTLVQGGHRETLAERHGTPLAPWRLWGPRRQRVELTAEAGWQHQKWLEGGEAQVEVTAERAGGWLRHAEPVAVSRTFPVRVIPPALTVRSNQHYLAQGGAGVVVYRVGEGTAVHGVEAGSRLFPGHPLPGGDPGVGFAFFAAPFDLDSAEGVRLVARDELGNEASVTFVDRFFPHPPAESTIDLSDSFLTEVVPEIAGRTPGIEASGDLLAGYLQINGPLREKNRGRLRELAASSRPAFLWHRPFLPLPHGQVMAPFAVRRTYRYQGKTVDHQVHLGFDLASVARAPVPAANDGVVMLAEYFGIYGNAVILDHGYGLMTLYAHLSDFAVAAGDTVTRGQLLGHTGATGLAGGDHLHFATLVDGVPVDPREWWDGAWIRDRVAAKLDGALRFEGP